MSNGHYDSHTPIEDYHRDNGLCHLRSVEDAGTNDPLNEWTRVYCHRPPRITIRPSFSYDIGEVDVDSASTSGWMVP